MAEEGQEQQEQGQPDQGAENMPGNTPAPADGGKPEPDWKAQARKWEERAKANAAAARKLADLEAANMSAQEQAEARAKAAEAKAAALVESRAAAKLEAALTGLVEDAAEEVADLDVRKFMTDDGDVDAEKVARLRQRYAARVRQGPRVPAPNPAQGSGQPPRSMAEIIADAERSGDPRKSVRLKSQQLLELRRQQG